MAFFRQFGLRSTFSGNLLRRAARRSMSAAWSVQSASAPFPGERRKRVVPTGRTGVRNGQCIGRTLIFRSSTFSHEGQDQAAILQSFNGEVMPMPAVFNSRPHEWTIQRAEIIERSFMTRNSSMRRGREYPIAFTIVSA